MTSPYGMQDLLNLISTEGAERLVLQIGKAPVVYVRGENHVIEGPHITRENAAELFRSVATPEQIRELDSCGDVHFIYSSPEAARFVVKAQVEHEDISLEIRNLAAPSA